MGQESLHTRHTLLQKICDRHDDKAWEDFVYYYEKYIYLICRRTNLNHLEAQELVQQVMVKLWTKLPEFKLDVNKRFRSWLCQVTRNTVMDHFRVIQRREKRLEKAYDSEHWAYYREDSLPEFEALAEKEWENYLVNMALQNLKNKVSEKMFNVFLELQKGKLHKQICEEMEMPLNSVYVYQKRMMAKIKEEVSRLSQELS
ncbi:sigma-70 family RNA polymerase sigma factor [Lentisphaera profundi]|uniref:Sigma-70 family RNA polymerase sigma factor n=1 Tax=Lentisphaera profundi TaxID=1658616 RepID=A0ABY7VWZ2_9BACT|nr:sigma-70 family RNA polymerase sigma factor [Lentisphaera profundi]WDE98612.1 sigma-70 family RNA polymerase sigma factor [Lentisphaera profundi]